MTRHFHQVVLDGRYLSPFADVRTADLGPAARQAARLPLRDSDPGRVGRYWLIARLGSGGMGVVYLGVDRDGRQVAVKVLHPELINDPEIRARFGREADVLARVRSPHIVRVIEAGTDSPRPFLVTEYAVGPSLAEYVGSAGPFGVGLLYGLATGLAEALTAIHAAGVVHRDLKPANVILTAGGPKLIDFGIAHVQDSVTLTQTGMTVGSVGFMAPEQVMGEAGPATDIFAWAVTVAYAASGQSPFGAGPADAVMYRILHAQPSIASVPWSLRPLLDAALAKEPRDRPAARELLGQLTRSSAVSAPAPDQPWACRRSRVELRMSGLGV
jgi:serine/threonine protein kinase